MYTKEFNENRAVAAEEAAAPVVSEPGEEVEVMPVDILADVVKGLLTLSPEQRDVVCLRYAGLRYREIAELQGSTVAAVEIRHKRALKKWPALQAVFSGKARKQETRRRPGAPPRVPVASSTRRRRGGWRRCGTGYVRAAFLDSSL